MKKLAYALGLTLMLAISLLTFHKVFSFKYGDGIYGLTAFYELEVDTVDVLVLGSSHAFENINPMIIWKDTGIAAYDLCGSGAPMWNSYYYLEEALKTQSPELVILEGFCLTRDYEYMIDGNGMIDDSSIIKNVYGLKPSWTKWRALKASAPEDRRMELGLEYIQYHNRYAELNSGDFKDYQDDKKFYSTWKGFGNNWMITPYEPPQVENEGTRADIPKKQAEYYKKIIELCKTENIPLLVIVTPYAGYKTEHMGIYNTAKGLADEYGVPFINFNDDYKQVGINWEEDFADDHHMSYLGNAKFSHYLSSYLQENYSWDSHEMEKEKYSSWDQATVYYDRSIANKELSDITNINIYGERLNQLPDGYTVIVTINTDITEEEEFENLWSVLRKWEILTDEGYNKDCAWIVRAGGVQKAQTPDYGYFWNMRFGDKELLVDDSGIYWNRENYQKQEEGINIVVFDEVNQRIADVVNIVGDALTR